MSWVASINKRQSSELRQGMTFVSDQEVFRVECDTQIEVIDRVSDWMKLEKPGTITVHIWEPGV